MKSTWKRVEVKVQTEEEEIGETHGREQGEEKGREQTITLAHDTWMGLRAPALEPMWYHTSLHMHVVKEKK